MKLLSLKLSRLLGSGWLACVTMAMWSGRTEQRTGKVIMAWDAARRERWDECVEEIVDSLLDKACDATGVILCDHAKDWDLFDCGLSRFVFEKELLDGFSFVGSVVAS